MEERKSLLAQNLALQISQGYRIESQSDTMAVIVYGHRVNHILHFIVGIFTFGIWWLAWIFMCIVGGEKRKLLTVDEYGNVTLQKA
jgi:hypothetical protein